MILIDRDGSLCSSRACGLFQQSDELITGQCGCFDDAQGEPPAKVAIVLRYHHTCSIAGTPQNDMAAGLMVNLKADLLQRPYDLTGLDCRQTRHQAGSRATVNRPTYCSSSASIGIGSPCLSRLLQ